MHLKSGEHGLDAMKRAGAYMAPTRSGRVCQDVESRDSAAGLASDEGSAAEGA